MPDAHGSTSTTTCIVQARMGSTRFPGKVLADVGGVPLLEFMLRRLSQLQVAAMVVATTVAEHDTPIALLAERCGVAVIRGDETDVLGRFEQAAEAHPASQVIRLTADCPLADPAVIEAALAEHVRSGADYTSNTLIRTFPDGLDVEVISRESLQVAAREARDPVEREHVTPFIYRRPERFRLSSIRTDALLGDERWTVDTPEDLERIRSLRRQVKDPTAGWVAFSQHLPPHDARGLLLRPGLPSDGDRLGAWPGAQDDPGQRAWVVERDGQAVGWTHVPVHEGVGSLQLRTVTTLTPTERTEALALTLALLQKDRQVAVLRVPRGELDDALGQLGFVLGEEGWSYCP